MNIHRKRLILFLIYITLNIILATIPLYFSHSIFILPLFAFSSKLRDFINIIIQLLNINKIIKKLPDIDEEIILNICALIPTYKEDLFLVKNNIDSLVNQKKPNNIKISIMVLCDHIDLYNNLDKIINYENDEIHEINYIHWKDKSNVKLSYKKGLYKNINFILGVKEKGLGKKDSLIIGEHLMKNFSYNVDFVYHTDSDTVADENCIYELTKSLYHKNLDGVSGLVRGYFYEDFTESFNSRLYKKCYYIMQDFQYFYSLIIRRQALSIFNSTICLPGCVNMIRLNKIAEIAIKKYENNPNNVDYLFQSLTRLQGTDRRYTTLLLRQGAKLQMNYRAFVFTEPPLNAKSFIKQRVRWSSNAFFNSISLLYSKNINYYAKISILTDVLRLFSTNFRFYSIIIFWIYLSKNPNSIIFIITFIIILTPIIYSFLWWILIVKNQRKNILGFFINKLFQPIFSFIVINKMFFTCTKFIW